LANGAKTPDLLSHLFRHFYKPVGFGRADPLKPHAFRINTKPGHYALEQWDSESSFVIAAHVMAVAGMTPADQHSVDSPL